MALTGPHPWHCATQFATSPFPLPPSPSGVLHLTANLHLVSRWKGVQIQPHERVRTIRFQACSSCSCEGISWQKADSSNTSGRQHLLCWLDPQLPGQ